jgi:DNA-binding response OmpR family regulator
MEPVLIVTSDPNTRQLLELAVTGQGLTAHVLPTVTAPDSAKWTTAPLVLIDAAQAPSAMDMPGRNQGLVVVFATAASMEAAAELGMQIGAPYVAQIPHGMRWLTTHIALHAARVAE